MELLFSWYVICEQPQKPHIAQLNKQCVYDDHQTMVVEIIIIILEIIIIMVEIIITTVVVERSCKHPLWWLMRMTVSLFSTVCLLPTITLCNAWCAMCTMHCNVLPTILLCNAHCVHCYIAVQNVHDYAVFSQCSLQNKIHCTAVQWNIMQYRAV